jgi:hypothetical protein
MEYIKTYDNFTVEDLGIQDEWVYDIEVENNHNFFGNNILVHNSVYFHIEPFMEMYQEKNPGMSIDHYVEWADQFEQKIIQPCIERTINDFSKELNAFNKDVIGAEREIIADAAVFASKKKYFARVRDSEGTRFPEDNPYIKVMGLELIKSSTPKWSQKNLKEAIPHILDKDEKDLRNWVKEKKKDFINVDLNDIASVSGVKNVLYNPKDLDKNGRPKSMNIGTKAAMAGNSYIENNKLDGKYSLIKNGDKTKRLFLIQPNKFNSNIVAFTTDSFTKEIEECVDYDENFQKNFLKPLETMVDALGWDLEKETEDLDDW